MKRHKLFWRVFPLMLLITVLSLAGMIFYATHLMDRFHQQVVKNHLGDLAAILAAEIEAGTRKFETEDLQHAAVRISKNMQARLTVVDVYGVVLADTDEKPEMMSNHSDRPEIRKAMTGQLGWAVRYSSTLRHNMLYVACPVRLDGEIVGIVRASQRLALLEEQLKGVSFQLVVGGVALCIIAFLLSIWLTRSITEPLQALQAGTARFAEGDLKHHLGNYTSVEMNGLAQGINTMADQLATRLKAIRVEHAELEAIISSMIEGVMAVDENQQVFKANSAVAKLLGVDKDKLVGNSLENIIRNSTLEDFVAQTLIAEKPVEGEAVLYGEPDRTVRIHGTRLHNAGSSRNGAVIVLNDITRLRRLESIRRQFASNVSHELKTPITSIQGYVETLLDGALEDSPEDVRHFLDIILRQTKRLNAIMEDILMLSRIEQDDGDLTKTMGVLNIQTAVKGAVDQYRERAADKNIKLLVECPETVMVHAHSRLLEQAIVNLLGNAVNYSPNGETVLVRVETSANEASIHVIDHGVGITRNHLSRLFERFYRVDKARSREAGGTGLGLAIVKHIIQVHNGKVTVDSTPGKGSTFTLTLPTIKQ